MPVIPISTADILRSKNLEQKWYSWQLSAITGPVKNAGGDGVNYVTHFTLIDEDDALNGKEIKRTFSSKAIGMIIPLYAACMGVEVDTIKPESFQLDTDQMMGKKFDGYCSTDIYNGNPTNKVEQYAAYKKMKGAPGAF